MQCQGLFSTFLTLHPITEASEMDYPMKNSLTRWCDTAHGLICLANKENSDKPVRMTNKLPSSGVSLYIWNPSIRKSRKLPDSGVKSKWFCSTYFRYGFGYDELHDDYKLVVIFNIFDDHRDDYASFETKIKVYSLKSDSWRSVEDFQGSSLVDCSAKFVKGKLYWTKSARAREHNSYYGCTIIHFYEYDDGNSCNIISFDLARETWGKVEQPNYGKGEFDLMLGVLGSDLAVLCNYEGSHSDVWVMKDYGVKASWTKMFTVSCPNDPGKYDCYPRCSLSFSPLFCQLYNGEILLLYRSVFMIYNPKDDSIRVIRQPEVTKPKSCFQAAIYVESLVNPLLTADQGLVNHED
ncbi:f-box protein cpr30 [Nicotiana attenuata]|uniref:F-box protein cpr30 n=2 Tax=Nicotiana attenuata TaxID=49451 RepID=A0A314L863_NICAT|nr:f-box protein cpr30 [Nicotiana attenuata]